MKFNNQMLNLALLAQSLACKLLNSNQRVCLVKNVEQEVLLDLNLVGLKYQAALVPVLVIIKQHQVVIQHKVVDVGKAYLPRSQQRSTLLQNSRINKKKESHWNQTIQKIKTGLTEFRIGAL